MAPTPQQRSAFGKRLRAIRNNIGQSAEVLADELGQRGFAVTRQAVGAWERGEYAPASYDLVDALERTLNVPGELAPLLGLEPPALFSDRLGTVENELLAQRDLLGSAQRELDAQRALLEQILKRLPPPAAE